MTIELIEQNLLTWIIVALVQNVQKKSRTGNRIANSILKVDFFINGDQFFFFLEKLRLDIDLILFTS